MTNIQHLEHMGNYFVHEFSAANSAQLQCESIFLEDINEQECYNKKNSTTVSAVWLVAASVITRKLNLRYL